MCVQKREKKKKLFPPNNVFNVFCVIASQYFFIEKKDATFVLKKIE